MKNDGNCHGTLSSGASRAGEMARAPGGCVAGGLARRAVEFARREGERL